jgi:chemosensory pili system protein ChpA (sensor histidine kinase/response regulator)
MPSPDSYRFDSYADDADDEQLWQELRSMFDVNVQKYLQTYINLVQHLRTDYWADDIQELYRCIHTVKGEAVTVAANPIVQVATTLEDLLSDLRFVSPAPSFTDGQLEAQLLEAGELLASSLTVEPTALEAVQPTVQRLLDLQHQIRQRFLPEFSEQRQLQQEFTTHGFDLVTLDLELALQALPATGLVPDATISIATRTLQQLAQVGRDLHFETGWQLSIQAGQRLLAIADATQWSSQWLPYIQSLKACAREGGRQAQPTVQPEPETNPPPTPDSPPHPFPGSAIVSESSPAKVQVPVPLERLERSAASLVETLLAARATQGSYGSLTAQLTQLVSLARDSSQYIAHLRQLQDDYTLLGSSADGLTQSTNGDSSLSVQTTSSSTPSLLTPERYRQGYDTLNRLLESSLRLSEVGAEVERTASQTAESLQALDRTLLQLQGTVEDSRSIPFATLGFRAKAILRDLVNRSGKPAQLTLRGDRIELDVGTLRGLEPVVMHLLRNAYGHGLESSAERLALGKPETGQIQLSLQRRGRTFQVELRDDGRGIDPQTIQAIAVAQQLPLSATDTPERLLAVLCQPGFSSQTQVDDVAGRGVGLDVVRHQIAQLGGKLDLQSTPGQGTTFQIRVPVPRLLLPCVILRAGEQSLAIPCEDILATVLLEGPPLPSNAAPHSSLAWSVPSDGEEASLDLWAHWQGHPCPRPQPETAIAVRIQPKAEGPCLWLLADEPIGQLDLLVTPLPSPLIAPRSWMGVSLQSDGTLMPVLEMTGLSLPERPAANPVTASLPPQQMPTTPSSSGDRDLSQLEVRTEVAPTVLIADDAALVRRRIAASLTACGYITCTCCDGREAWLWLQQHPSPDLMIVDIEMPQMNGLTLIEHCRKAGINTPILVISSRLSAEWHREAQRFGATDYLPKGFSTPELIGRVGALLRPQST